MGSNGNPNPQYGPEDLARRRELVDGIPSVRRIGAEDLDAADARSEQRVRRDLRFYRGLTDVRLRTSREAEWGVYLAESSKVLRRALRAGHEPVSFLMSDKWAADLEDVLRAHPEVPAYVGEEPVLEGLTGFHLHRGALAVMRRPRPLTARDLVAGTRRLAVLEDVVDHTNLGAIFRCAAALGVEGVLISPSCADPLYRRSLRVSMGTVFDIPWARSEDWAEDLRMLRQEGFTTAALALSEDALSMERLGSEDHERLALLLGSEGHGLSPKTLREVDLTVMIPMAGQVDSLNVAAAAAVAFWETRPRGALGS